jgi:membrane protein DedA with SNARE-associated domain
MLPELITLETLHGIAREYGYWAVFSGIALENAGIPLPGETITLIGGFLSGSGELDFWGVWGAATAGAILGDNFGYWIGRWGGWPLLLRLGRFFRLGEEKLIEARDRFGANAGKAVFLGRFVALLRIFAGPMAGIAQMPYWRFVLYNAAGAAVWASAIVSLSFFAGRLVPLETLMEWVGQLGLALLGVIALWLAVPLWLESRNSDTIV